MSTKYILKTDNYTYFNGIDTGIISNSVQSQADIDDEYIFDSVSEIKALPNYDTLEYWYSIVEFDGILKPKCPYDMYKSPKPKVLRGEHGEVCFSCGTNILAKEPYILWNGVYCIHCIMKALDKSEELLGSVPAELKEEWELNGKEKCLEHI